jgi:hypothetical protein
MAHISPMHRGAGRGKFPFSCSFLKYAIFAFYTTPGELLREIKWKKFALGKILGRERCNFLMCRFAHFSDALEICVCTANLFDLQPTLLVSRGSSAQRSKTDEPLFFEQWT